MPTIGWSGVRRAVVWAFEAKTLWGKLMYALDERGYDAVDAISAALIAKHPSIAREIRLTSELTAKTTKSMDFHSTSVHGITKNNWPWLGQLVELHLNENQRLVAVWYQERG